MTKPEDGRCEKFPRVTPCLEMYVFHGEFSFGLAGKLEGFIRENAHIPRLSYDARSLAYKSVYAANGTADCDNSVQKQVL